MSTQPTETFRRMMDRAMLRCVQHGISFATVTPPHLDTVYTEYTKSGDLAKTLSTFSSEPEAHYENLVRALGRGIEENTPC